MQLLVYSLVGLTAGVLGSMLGVGGGILMVPAIVYVCKIPTKSAAAMSLAVMIPMALTSTIRYLYTPEVRKYMELKPIVLMAALAIGGAFVGTEISKHLSSSTIKKIFAVIMAVVAVYMFFDRREPAGTKEGAGTNAAAGSAEGAKQP